MNATPDVSQDNEFKLEYLVDVCIEGLVSQQQYWVQQLHLQHGNCIEIEKKNNKIIINCSLLISKWLFSLSFACRIKCERSDLMQTHSHCTRNYILFTCLAIICISTAGHFQWQTVNDKRKNNNNSPMIYVQGQGFFFYSIRCKCSVNFSFLHLSHFDLMPFRPRLLIVASLIRHKFKNYLPYDEKTIQLTIRSCYLCTEKMEKFHAV